MRFIRLTPALLATLALAACGGDGGGGNEGEPAPQAGTPQEAFADTCGGCHTMKAAGTEGQVGPNLDELAPDAEQVTRAIEQGPGVMPENLLKGAQADEVAKYVADNSGG